MSNQQAQDGAGENEATPPRGRVFEAVLVCFECGAELKPGAQTCWMCGAATSGRPTGPPRGGASFSLATLLLTMTLIAVGFGVFAVSPGLGILFAIAALPALVRTAVLVRRRQARGKVGGMEEKLQLFAASLAVAVAAGVAAAVAFFCTCLATCFAYFAAQPVLSGPHSDEAFIFFSNIIAGSLALAAFAGVFYLCRERR